SHHFFLPPFHFLLPLHRSIHSFNPSSNLSTNSFNSFLPINFPSSSNLPSPHTLNSASNFHQSTSLPLSISSSTLHPNTSTSPSGHLYPSCFPAPTYTFHISTFLPPPTSSLIPILTCSLSNTTYLPSQIFFTNIPTTDPFSLFNPPPTPCIIS